MDKKFLVLMSIAVIFVVIAFLLTYGTSYYIHKTFTNLPVVKDLLWEKLPYYSIIWIAEIFLILSVIIGIIWAIKNKKIYLIPYAMIVISIFHIFRALLIVLTPLGFPYKYEGLFYSDDSLLSLGAFPSSHLSIPFLIYLISKVKIHILLSILVAVILLIARGHYSIDLIGTLLLAYPTFKFSEKYMRRYF